MKIVLPRTFEPLTIPWEEIQSHDTSELDKLLEGLMDEVSGQDMNELWDKLNEKLRLRIAELKAGGLLK